MVKNYARPLIENPLVESFLTDVLGYNKDAALSKIVEKIISAEIKMGTMTKKGTIFDGAYRHHQFRAECEREKLREQIVLEMIQNERLESDDDLELGIGGALPVGCKPVSSKSAYVIIGPPASGKSTVSNRIADYVGGVILDSDYVKRKLPEFNQDSGASLVHEESSALILGNKRIGENLLTLYDVCVSFGYNIVIPKIGHDIKSLLTLCNRIKNDDYSVHLILVSLDREKSTQRALKRFIETERYVPLSLVFDGYGNDTILTYYRIKDNAVFSSYGKVSTDVAFGESPRIIDIKGESPIVVFKKGV